ncbi:tail fiber protein [Dyella sp. GSA-30]|uniref:phage tail protein n=1 Tax=Dyella sp. GSA-30 TaxID=2994496 RepID=UPI0024906796|nr:tail fiber protein [Dyella sp. GSA-30]BDU19168.1 microcystin dependent protein [Dyella sp. GSA-30]
MSIPFLGQVLLAGFNFAPKGFAACNGQLMAISQNQALFSLLGTTYGGNGVTTFALPNMQSRTPYGMGPNNTWGALGGTENVTLLSNQIPAHTHFFSYNTQTGNERSPANGLLGNTGSLPIYAPASGTPQVITHPNTIAPQGQNLPHSNIQPYTTLNFIIALQGMFPTRN